MNQDQEQRIHVCRFCNQSFSNGKKLGGHMRGHLALISASRKKGTGEFINGEKAVRVFESDDNGDHVIKKSRCIDQDYRHRVNGRKQSVQEHDREVTNGRKGLDGDDDELIKKIQQGLDTDEDHDANGRKQGIQERDFDDDDNDEKKSQQEVDFDQDCGASVYVLRENPKRSWRVSNSNSHSSKAFASHKRYHSRESIKNSVCEKCGKGFDSVKALYGHMRCHSIKKSQPLDESSAVSSSEEHDHEHDDGVANPVRKKRSCTRYKSPKPNNHFSTSLSSSNDDEVVQGAVNLMMLSKGVRSLDGVEFVISHGYSRTIEKNLGVDLSNDGSMEFCKFKNNSEMGSKKDLVFGSGSGQLNMGRVGSTLVKYKSTKKLMSTDEDFTDSEMSTELKRRSKEYKCPICFKGYVSIESLARHKSIHNKTESKVIESDFIPDFHRRVDMNLIREVSTRTM